MADLHYTVESLVEKLEISIKPELKMIQDKDWSTFDDARMRRVHKLQHIITVQNITHAERVHALATTAENIGHPRVKKILTSLIQFFDIYEERYTSFGQRFDWASYMEDEANEDIDETDEKAVKEREQVVEDKISFRSELLKNVVALKEKVRKIGLGEDKEIKVKVFNDTPIPMLMAPDFEKRYPEVKEFLDKRKAEYFQKQKDQNENN